MRIRLTLRREPQEDKNLAVTVDGLATVGDIATELYLADPSRKGAGAPAKLSLLVEESLVGGLRGRTLPPESNLLESGLRPGATVALTQVSDTFSMPGHDRGPAVATLRVVSGPDQGREFALPSGTSYIGRDFNVDVRLSDPMTSKRHARINVGETIEIVDTGSANGLLMEGAQVSRAVLGSYDEVTLGDSTISIVSLGNAATGGPTGPLVEFNRSPRVVPHFKVEEQAVPAGPQRPRRTRFPMLMLYRGFLTKVGRPARDGALWPHRHSDLPTFIRPFSTAAKKLVAFFTSVNANLASTLLGSELRTSKKHSADSLNRSWLLSTKPRMYRAWFSDPAGHKIARLSRHSASFKLPRRASQSP